jgi:murein DD-endopeptidase MepM/ murein hydrolase activator NlpD
VPAAVAVACLSIGAGLASAEGGGIAPTSPPDLTDAVCIDTCGGMHKATTDSTVQLSGRHLSGVREVIFKASDGGRLEVPPTATRRRSVTAKVPDGAATGRPKVVDAYANRATSPTRIRVVPPNRIPDTGAFKMKRLAAKPRKAYYDGEKKPRVRYLFTNTEPTDIRIDVVDRKTDEVVASFTQEAQEPNTEHTARWNGRISGTKRKRSVASGAYKFRVGPATGTLETSDSARFRYYPYKFPVRGPHTYGDGVGAPRAGHVHEGQDVLAACGTKLEATRGGRVQYRAYHSAAGNYIVIDGRGTKHDWMYAHLKKPSPLRKGDKVKTGQKIGVVGQTGDATACHLHIEEWSGPGWYEGGTFLKAITRHLKKWDSWS